jgi:hypothetical protein
MRYRQASLVFVGLFALARHGAAVPSLSVRASGSCPTQSELEAALVERGLGLGSANYAADVQSEATGATLRLQHSGQGQVLQRHFTSQDCRALAEAIAVVVEAYFIDMRGPDVEPGNASGGQGGATTALAPSPYPDNGTAPPPAQPYPMVTTPWRLAPPAPLGSGSTS